MEAVIIPEIHDELDTRNFEKYEEVNVILFFLYSGQLLFTLLCYLYDDRINFLL